MKKFKLRSSVLPFAVLLTFVSSCYYDNYEDLYEHLPQDNCDTPLSSYSQDIQPWIAQQCESCHNSSVSQGNLDLTTYANVSANATVVLDRISRQEGDALLMPQGGSRLDSCTIQGFSAWIDLGTPEN